MAAVGNQDTEDIEARLAVLAHHGQFIRSGGLVAWPDGTVTAGYGFLHDLYRETLCGPGAAEPQASLAPADRGPERDGLWRAGARDSG